MVTYLQEFFIENWFGVKVSGRLDAFNDRRIADQLKQMMMGKNQIVLDLEACDFMSLQMLRFISDANKEIRKKGGELALVSLNHNIRRQIEIFLGTRSFTIYQNLRDLNNGLNRQPRSEFQNHMAAELVRSGL